MGCVASKKRIDREERVQICRERRRMMKQLLLLRSDFAAAQMAYLQALKNTGATLRQFTDSDCLDAEILLPLHLDLPSPPPPLPTFSDDDDDDDAITLPPPPLPWDPPSSSSSSSSPQNVVATDIVLNPISKDSDSLETPKLGTKTASTKKKTLSGIVKEMDDYFLKASATGSGRDVILLLDVNKGSDSLYHSYGRSMTGKSSSSKVFSALSWNWSSRSLHSPKDTMDCYQPNEPCKPGAHGSTLERIHTQEEKLYKEVKEEENTKLEYERKTLLLQKNETGDQDMLKTEEIRSSIEALQYDICCFQQLISETNSTILKLIEDELHPQLIMLSSGLMHMWKTMYDCHEVQKQIAQQMNYLTNHSSIGPTTDYHRQYTVQLETEVTGWYISFCNLLKSQHEYVQVLNRWVQLTDCLVDGEQMRNSLSIVQHLCEHWKLGMDQLPEKVAEEAIKSFLSVIHSIVLQQTEEHMLQKKSERLEKKLQREIDSLDEMEKKFESNVSGDAVTNLTPNHPLAVKRAKTEAFRKRVEEEKTKYLNSIKHSNSMTLNNLQTSLPNVFQALSTFSSVCSQVFEAVISHPSATVCETS